MLARGGSRCQDHTYGNLPDVGERRRKQRATGRVAVLKWIGAAPRETPGPAPVVPHPPRLPGPEQITAARPRAGRGERIPEGRPVTAAVPLWPRESGRGGANTLPVCG